MRPSTPPLELDQVLVIKPSIRVETLDSESMFFIGERQRFLLADSHAVEVASLIDGKRSIQDILVQASSEISEMKALHILNHLVARGYVVEAAAELPAQSAAFWHGVGLNAREVFENLELAPVSVRALGEHDFGPWMADALRQAGVHLDDASSMEVVVTDDYLRAELAAVNEQALRRKTPWFLVQPIGTRPLIGPMFRPGIGACWECLAFRMKNNRPVEELVRRHKRGIQALPPHAALEGSVRTACGLAALSIARELGSRKRDSEPTRGSQVLAFDLLSFETTMHSVVKRPQCAVCGDPSLPATLGERPILFEPVQKVHSEGGYRRLTPHETWERYRHLVSPITGPVAYVVPIPERSSELRAAYASGYLACPGGVPKTNSFDKRCAGKGRSTEQARASALCEALERYSGVYRGDEARKRASMDELSGDAISLEALTNFSEAQYRGATQSQPGTKHSERLPERLGSDVVIDWSPAWSLSHGRRRYVPLAYCYSDAPLESGALFCQPCGNGVAAGTCIEEAVLQGVLELVERDAVAIWWYNRVLRPGVDIDSFGDAYFTSLRAEYAKLGWTLWALDLTHDLGIATFVGLAHEPKEDRFAIGFGCHLDPHLALERALTEVNQLFDPAATRRAPWNIDQVLDRAYLFPHPRLRQASEASFPRIHGADLREDIEQSLARLHAAGLEVLVVNKTRPDIELSVAQVIVPGLRHFWPRFGPGRLYQVPHALGWVREPLEEENLNPVPLFV